MWALIDVVTRNDAYVRNTLNTLDASSPDLGLLFRDWSRLLGNNTFTRPPLHF